MATEVYAITVSGNLGGQFVQNVMHVGLDATTSRSAFANADDIIRTLIDTYDFQNVWLSILPVSYRWLSLRCRRVDPVHGATSIILAPTGSGSLGARSGEVSSQAIAPVVDLFNSVAANRIGKIFVPGISETDISLAVYTGAYTTVFDAQWKNYFNATYTQDLGTMDFNFGIFAKAKTPKFIATSDVRLSPLVGTQRRRLLPVA